jgi:GntR family transcriptional regulator/MocR family aminotransferase
MLRHPPSNNQYIIGLFLKRGYHDSLVRKMRGTLYPRSKLMAKLLDKYFPEAFPRLVFGGSAYWVKAPQHINTEQFAQKAKQLGILIESGNVFFAENTSVNHFFRLGFSSISSAGIRKGIPLLAKLMKEHPPIK